MIIVEINGWEVKIPSDIREIKLSQYIEYNKMRQIYYAEKKTQIQLAINTLKTILEIPDEIVDDLSIGDFSKEDKENTVGKLFAMVDSAMMSYEVPSYSLDGYDFEYKGVRYHLPCYFTIDGEVRSSLKAGEYNMAMNARKMIEDTKEQDTDGTMEFTGLLMVMSSIVRIKSQFKMKDGIYVFEPEESLLDFKRRSENAAFFSDISAQIGLDVNFFLSNSILS